MGNLRVLTLNQLCADYGKPGIYRICFDGFIIRFDKEPTLSDDQTFWKAGINDGPIDLVGQLPDYRVHMFSWRFENRPTGGVMDN